MRLKVCDPACGSGHFLLGAANRLAKRLASLRTGEEEPAPVAIRKAKRDVIGHCIYGVDVNPMSVELCKVSLWIEALEPGKPLSFLDHHIQCGNSLLGATPALLDQGIPEAAFEPIEGDDKAFCRELKKLNKEERTGQTSLFLDEDSATHEFMPWERLGDLAAGMQLLDEVADDTIGGVRQQEELYAELVRSQGYLHGQFLADTWCAAFVWKKDPKIFKRAITQSVFRRIRRNPHDVPAWMREEVQRLAAQYRFFHWHLAFPDVFRVVSHQSSVVSKGGPDSVTPQRGVNAGEASSSPDSVMPQRGVNEVKHLASDTVMLNASEASSSPTTGFPPSTGRSEKILRFAQNDKGMGQNDKGMAQNDRVAQNDKGVAQNDKGMGQNDRGAALETRNSQLETNNWLGGFDVVLGNPPWERIKLQEKEWFAARRPEIANAANAAQRQRLIKALEQEDPALLQAFLEDRRQAEGESQFVRGSGRFPLCGRGDVNTYAIFAETNRLILGPIGRAGFIVPSGIATDDTTKFFFQDLMETHSLANLYDFENREKLFPAVDSRMKFALVTLSGPSRPVKQGAEFVFFALNTNHLREPERRFTLSAQDIALLNPNTRTSSIFRSRRDAELTKAIYRRVPVLIKEGPPEVNPWGIRFGTLFHMANDSGLFRTREQLEPEGWRLDGNIFRRGDHTYLPLYEAKLLHHFDHRWATYQGLDTRDLTLKEKQNPACLVLPRYWVSDFEVEKRIQSKWKYRWLFGFRDITNTTNERTMIATTLPKVGAGHKIPLIILESLEIGKLAGLNANLASLPFDYISRQKLGGTSMTYFYLKQFPVLPPSTYEQPVPWRVPSPSPLTTNNSQLKTWLLPRVLELTYTAWDLEPFARDCGYDGPPFQWDEERRFLLRCELDAAYFHLYGIGREDVEYIMDTFPIVRRKDEANFGEYRTKRVILEIYDAMQQAIRDGQPYQTRLDPPPADPRVAHPITTRPRGAEHVT